jgi:hypothetical protein
MHPENLIGIQNLEDTVQRYRDRRQTVRIILSCPTVPPTPAREH